MPFVPALSTLPTILAAGRVVYGRKFNPLITVKTLSFFDDVPALSIDVRAHLVRAVESVNITNLPVLHPDAPCSSETRPKP
jgi:hypothetical protein